jgi:hypothetical protein
MQDRVASLTGRTLKLTLAINGSCLAKERGIPENDNSEKCVYIPGGQFLKDLLKLYPV